MDDSTAGELLFRIVITGVAIVVFASAATSLFASWFKKN